MNLTGKWKGHYVYGAGYSIEYIGRSEEFILDLIDHLVQKQMVWIHCAKNYRVASLMYLYRQYYMNIDMPTAQEEFHKIWEPNETWTGLIHAVALQLQGRKATQDLQQELAHSDHLE